MSVELKDFRCKISPEIDAALEAESRIGGRDRAEIAREILHAWALRKLHEASVLISLARTQGLIGESQGVSGTVESVRWQGTRR